MNHKFKSILYILLFLLFILNQCQCELDKLKKWNTIHKVLGCNNYDSLDDIHMDLGFSLNKPFYFNQTIRQPLINPITNNTNFIILKINLEFLNSGPIGMFLYENDLIKIKFKLLYEMDDYNFYYSKIDFKNMASQFALIIFKPEFQALMKLNIAKPISMEHQLYIEHGFVKPNIASRKLGKEFKNQTINLDDFYKVSPIDNIHFELSIIRNCSTRNTLIGDWDIHKYIETSDTITLKCNYPGFSSEIFSWKKNGIFLKHTGSEYKITSPESNDSGIYICTSIIHDCNHKNINFLFNVNIYSGPDEIYYANYTRNLKNLTVTCACQGNPLPLIHIEEIKHNYYSRLTTTSDYINRRLAITSYKTIKKIFLKNNSIITESQAHDMDNYTIIEVFPENILIQLSYVEKFNFTQHKIFQCICKSPIYKESYSQLIQT